MGVHTDRSRRVSLSSGVLIHWSVPHLLHIRPAVVPLCLFVSKGKGRRDARSLEVCRVQSKSQVTRSRRTVGLCRKRRVDCGEQCLPQPLYLTFDLPNRAP